MLRPPPSLRLARQGFRTAQISHKFNPATRRYLTTEPPHKTSRSWKNSATRWAIAIGGVYWYNTTPLFAEQQQYTVQNEESPLPTLESLSRSSRFSLPSERDPPVLPVQPTAASPPSLDPKSPLPESLEATPQTQTPLDLESEAASQGAFNEETGEINWDCPCLGGMAHGPCGPEFREAFSCFVFSKEEPKGMDCVDKFKGMQTCFRAHPDEYGDQLEEDEEEIEQELARRERDGDGVAAAADSGVATALKEELGQDAKAGGVGGDASKAVAQEKKDASSPTKKSIYDSESESKTSARPSTPETNQKTQSTSSKSHLAGYDGSGDEGGEIVPKAAHDATSNSNQA